MENNQQLLEELHEKLDTMIELQTLEKQALFTKKDILKLIGWKNPNSKDIIEGYEKLGLLTPSGGRPKVYPGKQVHKLWDKLFNGQLSIPEREKIRSMSK